MKTFHVVTVLCLYLAVTQAQDTNMMEKLLKRIEALELQGSMQQRRIDQQDRLLEAYKDELQQYSSRIAHLEDQLSAERQEVPDGDDFMTPKQENLTEKTSNDKAKENNTRKSVRVSNIQARDISQRLVLENPDEVVAFHATYDKGVSSMIGLNQHLIFEDVHLNLGNAFHELHGLFIAPRSGIYIFSTSIMSAPTSTGMIASILKNGVKLANAHAPGGSYSQGSVSVVAQLNSGDEVWVSSTQHQSATDYGDMFTSFMGCLITEMA